MTNSDYGILCAASRTRIGVTAFELFREQYKSSKQPGKKVAGIYRKLHRLAGWGLLDELGGSSSYRFTEVRFTLSSDGRAAAEAECRRRASSRRTFPRLALCGFGDGGAL